MTAGLTAGFLAAFAHTVMPALASSDDAAFVVGFVALDKAVSNPRFMVPFTLTPVLVGVATLLAFVDGQRTAGVLLTFALALAVATVLITGVVHLPLNAEIGDVVLDSGDLAAARSRFEERWVRWNVVRTVTSTGSLTLPAALLRVH
ncbi:anthrone oxygenase family protein [Nocardioides sp. B-3]|uniref:anthrone oxygenase family protein n=1 Tax=Nocardioides sp. B-3 TaxID=2895565 RepID=UPI002152A84F|nr:anthrone oxygenase family protein [Nocardioides sp. B-3]UUZ60333.1 DUF1772 domain-containing protein [Nocardioides sp. B-3]